MGRTVVVEPATDEGIARVASMLPESDAEHVRSLASMPEEFLALQTAELRIGGEPVAIAGVTAMGDPGSLMLFACVTDEARKHPVALVRWARACVQEVETTFTPRRIELTVESDNEQLSEWAKSIGFEYEGRMRRYGRSGRDHDRYARIPEPTT